MESNMKKLMFICLLIISVCKGADSWDQAVQDIPDWQQREVLDLLFKQIDALPANFNPLQLRVLDLSHNQLIALPANFNPLQLQFLYLDHNRLGALPANFNPPQLEYLYLNNNGLAALPANFNAPELRMLDLSYNNILVINPTRLLEQFPRLEHIDLSNNPELYQENIQELRDKALAARRNNLTIIAENIRPEGQAIKGSEE